MAARNVVLLAFVALATMALTASSASAAETPIHVESEVTGEPCNPCLIEIEGDSTLVAHTIFGEIPVSACHDVFEAEIDEDGSGQVISYTNDHPAAGTTCSRSMGNSATHSAWPIHNASEEGGNTGHVWVDFSLDAENNPGGTDVECEAKIDIEETVQHRYHFLADHDCAFAELDGEWEIKNDCSHELIEIVHV